MFQRDIYIARRAALKAQVTNGIILLLGNEDCGMSYEANTYPFRQDSSFLYYVGIDKPSLTFVMDLDNDQEILFGDEATVDDIVWTGPQESLQSFANKSGITIVNSLHSLSSFLHSVNPKKQTIHFLPPYRPEHTLKISQWLQLALVEVKSKASLTLIKAIVAARSIKSGEEIIEMEKAIDVTVDMQLENMGFQHNGVTEALVAGCLHGIAIGGGGNIAFPTILTVNGETLHNHYRNEIIRAGQMVLCDCGAETDSHYGGDLTRTVPVNKSFTAQQQEIYTIVLQAQKLAIEAAKPGILFKEVHAIACGKLLEGLGQIGIIKGDIKEALANDVHTLFFQCGLGHMLGLDTHDMENLGEAYVGYTDTIQKNSAFGWKSLRLAKSLEPGFVVTIEPGLYFIPELIDQWKAENKLAEFINYDQLEAFRNFGGIRIEDDILITENGNRVLGKHLPKEVKDMEEYQYRLSREVN